MFHDITDVFGFPKEEVKIWQRQIPKVSDNARVENTRT